MKDREMSDMRVASVICATLLASGCSGEAASNADGAWVGTVTSEGNVTTVVNESGSVWGGPATLVEQASIGVEIGPPEYMLGFIGGLWATDDEIYVIDSQAPAVRIYDYDGIYLRTIGRSGQGPGEYMSPRTVYTDDAGRIYVQEASGNARVNIYDHEGDYLDTWSSPAEARLFTGPLIKAIDGAFYTRLTLREDPSDPNTWNRGMQQVGPEGAIGDLIPMPELDFERLELAGDRSTYSVPYGPYQVSAFSPAGAWIVGVNDAYRFEIHYPNGSITRVEKFWDPVPIGAAEAEYRKRWTTGSIRRNDPDWNWNGPPIPEHKPAYYLFTPSQSNHVLVVREGPSHRVQGPCDETYEDRGPSIESCYEPERAWDLFDLEGNFLGEVIRPAGRLFQPFFRDDLALIHVEDEMGTIMVKRYRLTPPATGSQ
jgi:hypothetical protein